VSQTSEIYSQAQKVLIWLGVNREAEAATNLIRRLEEDTEPKMGVREWRILSENSAVLGLKGYG
jgi:hypothetical protein